MALLKRLCVPAFPGFQEGNFGLQMMRVYAGFSAQSPKEDARHALPADAPALACCSVLV